MELTDEVLWRLQEERFQRPEHLLHLDRAELGQIVRGLNLGVKASFFHAVHFLREQAVHEELLERSLLQSSLARERSGAEQFDVWGAVRRRSTSNLDARTEATFPDLDDCGDPSSALDKSFFAQTLDEDGRQMQEPDRIPAPCSFGNLDCILAREDDPCMAPTDRARRDAAQMDSRRCHPITVIAEDAGEI